MNPNLYIQVDEVVIDPYDLKNVEKNIKEFDVQEQTANEIRAYAQECINGEITDGYVTTYIPVNLAKASPGSVYQGYGNKYYYYDETLYGRSQTEQRPVSETYGNWQSYFTNGINTSLQYFSNKTLNTITTGKYAIAKAVLSAIVPQSVPTVDDYSHEARLRFDKYVKNMYVYENDQYYFGCHTEKITAAKFNNVLSIGGYSSSAYDLPDKELGSQTLPKYSNSNAEQKAYYGYVGSGYTEYVDGYYFGGCFFEVT